MAFALIFLGIFAFICASFGNLLLLVEARHEAARQHDDAPVMQQLQRAQRVGRILQAASASATSSTAAG